MISDPIKTNVFLKPFFGPSAIIILFSSPGQSSGRAIALPPVLASASTFTLKLFKSSYFPNHMMDLVHIWYDDIDPKFISAIPQPMPMILRSR